MKIKLLMPICVFAGDWSAYSFIEKAKDGKSYRETVYLVNESGKTITSQSPNFQFPGHDDTPAESIGPIGDLVLATGDAVRFVHTIPIDRENGFAESIGMQDLADEIPIKRLQLKADFGHE